MLNVCRGYEYISTLCHDIMLRTIVQDSGWTENEVAGATQFSSKTLVLMQVETPTVDRIRFIICVQRPTSAVLAYNKTPHFYLPQTAVKGIPGIL